MCDWSSYVCSSYLRALLTFGTILREGETWDSQRVRGAAGPAVAAAIHAMHARGRDIRHIPGASAWLDALDGIDPSVQHLETHRGHFRYLNNLEERMSVVRERVCQYV